MEGDEKNIGERVLQFLMYGNYIIALAAAAQFALSRHLFASQDGELNFGNLVPNFPVLLVPFLITLSVYSFTRVVTLTDNPKSELEKWCTRHQTLLSLQILPILPLAVFLLAATYIFVFFESEEYSDVLVSLFGCRGTFTPLVLIILYVTPTMRRNRGRFTLRTIPLLKIFIIAYVWAHVASYFLSPLENKLADYRFLSVFLFTLAITLPFDFRDKRLDLADQPMTLADVFSRRQLIWISMALIAGAFWVDIALMKELLNGNFATAWLCVGGFYAASIFCLVRGYYGEKEFELFVLLDGLYILQFLLYSRIQIG